MLSSISKIAFGLIFVVAVIVTMFAAGSFGKIVLEKMAGVDSCVYVSQPVAPGGKVTTDKTALDNCKQQDVNNTKRDVADALAMLIVSLPVGVFFYRRVRV